VPERAVSQGLAALLLGIGLGDQVQDETAAERQKDQGAGLEQRKGVYGYHGGPPSNGRRIGQARAGEVRRFAICSLRGKPSETAPDQVVEAVISPVGSSAPIGVTARSAAFWWISRATTSPQ
jgi:hypothetical protein